MDKVMKLVSKIFTKSLQLRRLNLVFRVCVINLALQMCMASSPLHSSQAGNQQEKLIHAIWQHDCDAVQDLLKEGLNPNFLFRTDPKDAFITPLSEAIAEH